MTISTAMEDIIFVTVDCWRDEAADRMSKLGSMTEEWQQSSVICASAATVASPFV
jgi:hypothetical protein